MTESTVLQPDPEAGATLDRTLDGARAFDGSPHCLMLVDDEPVITEVLQLYLQDAGYSRFVVTSHSAGAATLARERDPDVVLLDLMMPEVSGFQVLQELRRDEATRHLPVIVLTSATDPDSKLRALELGATDFLAKPVDPSELALRVRNILAVKAYQDRLAFCDHLTGLPNRGRYLDRLGRALTQARDGGRGCAVLQLGMDRFRQINDALGYGAGDQVLCELAARISARLSDVRRADGSDVPEPFVARTGGDEFAVLLSDVASAADVAPVADALRACVTRPMTQHGETLYLSASVGVALSPQHGDDVDALLARAAQALSYAKKRGGDVSELYSDEIDSWARERLCLERDLRSAAASGALSLGFQPKVSTASGHVVGAEALLRWQHPTLGSVSPGEFIPLAEKSGLIVPIGAWVLREACRHACNWHRRGLDGLRVAVNVSARQFREPDLCQVVRAALDDSGLPPECLTLEVTESMLMANQDEAASTVEALKAVGVKVSVDDFGTGYSSLARLKRFSVDELKIDQSFVREVPHNEDDAAIVTAVVAMARSLGLQVVAEGVETPAQLDFLSLVRCDQYQGFLFSRAVPADEFAALAAAPVATPIARSA